MGWQEDFRMDNAALAGVVMGQPVPLVCDFLAASVGCCGNRRLAFPPADNLNAAMVNCDSTTSRFRIIKPAKTVQTRKRVYCFCGCAGIAAQAAQGVQPLVAAMPPMSVRRGSKRLSLCADKPSAERTTPDRVYKCALCSKGIIRSSVPRLVFSEMPSRPCCAKQAAERSLRPRRSCQQALAQRFPDSRPGQ